MHYDIIIVSSLKLDEKLLEGFNYLLVENAEINDDYSITYQNKNIKYDFLIIDKLYDNLKTLKEDKRIITNQFFETSIENVFAIGPINNSPLKVNKQLQIILNHLKNPL
ncbi:MAG TPA: hypothetical protein GXZ48_08040 [Acholeplasmataceae bacterium]|nr:hypothetical protein [Acholeplasmataceae bacterium]